jgi:hypothetical protein
MKRRQGRPPAFERYLRRYTTDPGPTYRAAAVVECETSKDHFEPVVLALGGGPTHQRILSASPAPQAAGTPTPGPVERTGSRSVSSAPPPGAAEAVTVPP